MPGTAATAASRPAAGQAYPAFPGRLYSVAAISADDVWAAGLTEPGGTLILHWNGKTWTIQRFHAPAAGGHFAGVAATSARNAWAVGATGELSEGTSQQTLVEHWNGSAWTRVPSPNLPGSTASFLQSVAAESASNAWAVGYAAVGDSYKAIAMHWNGHHWTLVPASSPGGAAVSRTSIWAVGTTDYGSTLIMHWNGKSWS